MPEFVEVATLEQLPPGKGLTVQVGDQAIALFNVDGAIYATADACLHAGASLGKSLLKGKIVRCRDHAWRYDVTTGKAVFSPTLALATYPVQVVEGKILVELGGDVRNA